MSPEVRSTLKERLRSISQSRRRWQRYLVPRAMARSDAERKHQVQLEIYALGEFAARSCKIELCPTAALRRDTFVTQCLQPLQQCDQILRGFCRFNRCGSELLRRA